MTPQELANILSQMYHNAPDNEITTAVHLFGIRYADEIHQCGVPVTQLVGLSSIPASYEVEVSKGVRLARYVVERR